MSSVFTAVLIIVLSNVSCQQHPPCPYNLKLITKETEINFASTDKRGIMSADGTIYFVPDSDKSVIIACRDNKVIWRVNASSECGLATIHQAVRYLKLTSNKLEAVYGKHSFLSIKRSTGQVTCEGSD
ncbi:hypothetical protein ACFPAF_15060 [Hymenobacter endophyticus]|uniref:Uncharacterized protein n=1 Tax=Hymenobacter endophyticus TaxID=3076335 RepID=A0ABU3TK22_9BACT|nr:hypothetical protein [Hymenobacter endophyticus]MDU0371722.1 hypothetical protein [Hymenobacter endophyticus]